jgi:glyoxylase-like metal-dependent hydrolase (beta-lactamase superfamily II)
MGVPGTIAAYLLPHKHGAILIETGPGTTLPALEESLRSHGYELEDISDVLLTHIHLDHAGAAGALSRLGANVYVHHVGFPHMQNPDKLLASAERIYGEMMDQLWGEMVPVGSDRLVALQHGDVVEIEGLCFYAIDTPGHANHHLAYKYEDICFSGDIGGVRLFDLKHIQLPMPPPEFNLDEWRESLKRLAAEEFSFVAPTHFGIYDDIDHHLFNVSKKLDLTEQWINQIVGTTTTQEDFNADFINWIKEQYQECSLSEYQIGAFETANPSCMSSLGLYRYWQKHLTKKNK